MKTKAICLFEDAAASRLHPLALTRPVFDLRCGARSLREKIQRALPNLRVYLVCREHLVEVVREQNPDAVVNQLPREACLFINGRLLFKSDEALRALVSGDEGVFEVAGRPAVARLGGPAVEKAAQLLQDGTLHFAGTLPRGQAGGEWEWIDYPWDLVRHNPAEVERDFDAELGKGRIDGQVSSHAVLVKQERIFVGKGSVVKAGVVVDASEGPVWLGQDVTVLPNAVILGPAYVGDHSVVKVGAKIYGGTSIGEVCKVGGEVEGSIIHSHSNKQHEGFLGHAYLGQWVNLGADTNNSDLKNNYGNVKVYVEGELVDSGSQFVGLFMGDHSKTGINTMFNTGTVVGVMSNVFGADFPPKFVPSFAWGGRAGLVEHELEKALQTARAVMARRAVEMSAAQERLFRRLFEMTRAERRGLQDLA